MSTDAEGPDYFIQDAGDRQEEQQDAFDAIHPVIGGRADGYIAAVRLPDDGYLEKDAGSVDAAYEAIAAVIEEHELEYELPDDPDEIVVTERDWA